jgi:capsule polysaccharide export protein KpsC/LpsZ
LQFHSKYGLKEIVEFIIKWAVKNKIKILFKKHPYDRKMNYLDQSIVDPEYIKIVREGDVHDYIKQAKAVFVANSGVGFEAMLYNKPIITFAQAIYDMVTFNCDIRDHDLTEIYQRATDQSIRSLEIEYSKFMSWYLFEEGTNISGERLNINLAIERFDNIENPFYRDIKNLLNSSKNEDCNKELIESGKRDGLIGFSKLFRFCKI